MWNEALTFHWNLSLPQQLDLRFQTFSVTALSRKSTFGSVLCPGHNPLHSRSEGLNASGISAVFYPLRESLARLSSKRWAFIVTTTTLRDRLRNADSRWRVEVNPCVYVRTTPGGHTPSHPLYVMSSGEAKIPLFRVAQTSHFLYLMASRLLHQSPPPLSPSTWLLIPPPQPFQPLYLHDDYCSVLYIAYCKFS